ncbi:MAG: glycosyltransferase family 2 protein [Lachnospiraceae bacterium]|nr:glycosyltransferase family 2 protein [Lachnospiraceae bacterium]
MKTTVVIPNYNGIKYLENCIESLVLAKEQGEFAILVIDNGSTDGSLEKAKEYEANGLLTVVAFPKNTGFCGAVNEGIRRAQTEYVLLLNNDTEVTKDFVKNLEIFMDEHADAFSASSKMLSLQEPEVIDDCGDLYCALGWAFGLGKGKNIRAKAAKKYEKNGKIFAACGGASIYRKAVLDEIGVFDENHFAYLEDIDIGYRALIYGYHNYYCHSAVVYHAGSGFSGSRYNKFKIDLSAKNSIYLIYKNMPLLQVLLNLPFLLIGFLVKTMFFLLKGFGGTYLKGLMNGLKLSFSKEGKTCKVAFKGRNLVNYIMIQWYLWWNLLRRFIG